MSNRFSFLRSLDMMELLRVIFETVILKSNLTTNQIVLEDVFQWSRRKIPSLRLDPANEQRNL